MIKTYLLPAELKKELKRIWGKPFLGEKEEVIKKFKEFSQKKIFKKIITVGDYCSLTLPSNIKIFDGKIKREKINPSPPKFTGRTLKCHNPAGTIQANVWPVLKKTIENRENLFIEGEEDLLVIPAVLLSEKGTAVVYGLPDKGICLIENSLEVKKEFKELLKKFEVS